MARPPQCNYMLFTLFLVLFKSCDSFSLGKMQMRLENDNTGMVGTKRSFLAKTAATVVVGSAASFCVLGGGKEAMAATLPSTGTKAPMFELENSKGTGKTSLEGLVRSGKWTVLYFYPGAFTSGCTLEARGFQKDIEMYRKLNAQIVGVSVDPVEKNSQFCSAEGLDFYMLSDVGGQVSRLYGTALSIPGFGTFSNRQTYIIDPEGMLRHVFLDVESHVARHSSEVLEKLGELEQAA